MTTKEAAKKVRQLVDANKALLTAIEERGAHMCSDMTKIKSCLPEAEKAVEVLGRRFP